MASAEEENRRLFVGGLNGVTTDATFRAHFARFFPVANAEVSKTETKLSSFLLGEPPKQIFGKSWEFDPRRGGRGV